jgi:hypothetical protein
VTRGVFADTRQAAEDLGRDLGDRHRLAVDVGDDLPRGSGQQLQRGALQ